MNKKREINLIWFVILVL